MGHKRGNKNASKPETLKTLDTTLSALDNLPTVKEENKHEANMDQIEHDEQHIIHVLPTSWMPGMNVPAKFYLNEPLYTLMGEEMDKFKESGGSGFIPAIKQLAHVACMPGIVKASIGLPDIHSGYGFAIGNVAAFDCDDPLSVVSPGGVGFDINCGVRLIRTNLSLKTDVRPVQDALTQALFDHIPVGVGASGGIKVTQKDLDEILNDGIDWAIKHGYAWAEDKDFCEENGKMSMADCKYVSDRAKKRGRTQIGTLGAGNHYAEIQAIEEIYDPIAAKTMGINEIGQICIMIHSGSRGLGHQVATGIKTIYHCSEADIHTNMIIDYIDLMNQSMKRDHIILKDKQLACARIHSQEGQEYLKGMAASANFAYCNRSVLTYQTRLAFSQILKKTAKEMDMSLIYDVSHNMAKYEDHIVDGKLKKLLVHRKGSTRAFCPHHPLIPEAYQSIGQPVLVGGSMGTCSYVLTGTEKGMIETFGSTCHGAGRAQSRTQAKKHLSYEEVMKDLRDMGISFCVANPKNVVEEAPGCYKDVSDVVDTCELAGISKKVFKLIPVGVIKG